MGQDVFSTLFLKCDSFTWQILFYCDLYETPIKLSKFLDTTLYIIMDRIHLLESIGLINKNQKGRSWIISRTIQGNKVISMIAEINKIIKDKDKIILTNLKQVV